MTAIPDINTMIKSATGGLYGLNGLVQRLSDGASAEYISTIRQAWIDGIGEFTTAAFKEYSLWTWAGVPFSGGAVPTTWANPDRSTAGALGQENATATARRLVRWNASTPSRSWFTLYDRLAHCGGLDGTDTGVQDVNGGADGTWSRYAGDHVGNQIWIEIYDDIGSAQTITASYKNESGATKTTQPRQFGGTGQQLSGRILRLPLAQGDQGVSAVIRVTISASTGTVGDFGVTVARPIAVLAQAGAGPGGVSFLDAVMPTIETDACLAIAGYFASASGHSSLFEFCFVED